jgi:hypothetical protein
VPGSVVSVRMRRESSVGKRNRKRRAASAGRRRPPPSSHQGHAGDAQGGAEHNAEVIEAALWAAADSVAGGDVAAGGACAHALLGQRAPRPAALVVQGTMTGLHRAVRQGWSHGWQPTDLVQITRRRRSGDHVALLIDALASEAGTYAPSTVDPRWWDQLRQLGADPSSIPRPSQGRTWLTTGDRELVAAVTVAIELLALIGRLPRLTQLLPLPGHAPVSAACPRRPSDVDVDQRQLSRIRALLAKAESTEFPDEAEALSAKAQQLMSRHAIERIIVDAVSRDDRLAAATARRLWLDAPYAGAKALLVGAVASANGCSAVWSGALGFTTVVGEETDLAGVELLCTSLLVQANRAMLAHREVRDGRGTSRTRSFRQSFLVSYATRIGERLREASTDALQDAIHKHAEADTAALLPVLAKRTERVKAACREMFPATVPLSVSVTNRQGWVAGHAAADLATLDVHRKVRGAERPAS